MSRNWAVAGLVGSSAAWVALAHATAHAAGGSDPRLQSILFDPKAVITVPVAKGIVTHVVLPAGETVVEAATGLGADCSKPDATWCIAAQPGDRNVFVKPKGAASAPNSLSIVTARRSYEFVLKVVDAQGPLVPVHRLAIVVPASFSAAGPPQADAQANVQPIVSVPELPTARQPTTQSPSPQVLNSSYSISTGASSEDIVPSLVFDDGRFTYLRFAGNRPVPAAFGIASDGNEQLVNARMQGDLLVLDRVASQLMLRSGAAVVEVWNDAFDAEGVPPHEGTTESGLARVMRRNP